MEEDTDCINGVYSLDINGSPSKMVVLSAKNNHMLAELFKVSANYLAKSPTKTNKNIVSHAKKKYNEDLMEETAECGRVFSETKNTEKIRNMRDKPPLKSNSKLRSSLSSNNKCS